MTTRPRLKIGTNLVAGLGAFALFVVMALTILNASLPEVQGFPEGANVTASIGYAIFNLSLGSVPGESFLAAFIIIAITLDVALDGAVHLARRQRSEKQRTILSDGGNRLKSVFLDEEDE